MWFLSRDSKTTENIIYAAYTDAGSRPGVNQDALFAKRRADFALFCVADGMGGHSRGELASAEIIKGMREFTEEIREPYKGTEEELFDAFEKVVDKANLRIYEEYNNGSICGSTVVAILFHKGKYCVVSVGDSRAYKNDGEEMIQITRDDVWENQVGAFDSAALNGKLLKAVGADENLICNRFGGKYKKGDQFFLCSDGIYKVLGDEFIKGLPEVTSDTKDDDAMEILQGIHKIVNDYGAPDNNTGILIKC